ncbi:MAG TPA: molecular chaperone HtpG [Bacteriovoracaceae bacterium]|nr:molecular chaperone HtpG [Bacteriovoracaceae bacterium]
MTTRKGSISVKTNDIFPIIKKWLYSEHDIFIRELVSNACDAITKRSTLARSQGQETPEGRVKIEVNKAESLITITDNGIGMTETEVEKYIAQLAFSGAEEFVQKMKDTGNNSAKDEIIGKFGLGFYSAFMVAQKVEVESLSMTPGSTPTKWICLGDTDYEFAESTKSDVGTTIKLFIGDDGKEFLDTWKFRETLTRYCDFMPYPIALTDKSDAEAKEEVINETTPLWKKDPSTLTDQDYKDFYRKMFPMEQEPLFWLHLNVDHPFTLQGVLFFPKLNPSKPVQENGIKLYSKQVFVSDNVKSVVPDFLGLLKGAIDSIDIPLNVSRSSLQGDPNIKKISNYIIKKVSESLKKLFNSDRERYEKVWEDIGLFVKYGCMQDTKFDEVMRKFVLFKNSESKLVTLEDYQASVPEAYKEKLKDKYVYFEKNQSDEALRKQLLTEGINVIETDQYIDPHFMQHAEMSKIGEQSYKFAAIDSEVENLLDASETSSDDMKVKDFFRQILVGDNKEIEGRLEVDVKNLKNASSSAYFKVDENMKRFQQMTKSMGNTAFSMPIKKTLVVNPRNVLIQNALKIWEKGEKKDLAEKICHHVQDLATLSSEGLTSEDKEKFVNRSQNLVQELSQYIV